jgi:hypothetical protein
MEEDKVGGLWQFLLTAEISGVRSARCKATLNTRMVSRWLFMMYLRGNILPVVQTVLHLIHPSHENEKHPIYFPFYPFHHFPFSEVSPS